MRAPRKSKKSGSSRIGPSSTRQNPGTEWRIRCNAPLSSSGPKSIVAAAAAAVKPCGVWQVYTCSTRCSPCCALTRVDGRWPVALCTGTGPNSKISHAALTVKLGKRSFAPIRGPRERRRLCRVLCGAKKLVSYEFIHVNECLAGSVAESEVVVGFSAGASSLSAAGFASACGGRADTGAR